MVPLRYAYRLVKRRAGGWLVFCDSLRGLDVILICDGHARCPRRFRRAYRGERRSLCPCIRILVRGAAGACGRLRYAKSTTGRRISPPTFTRKNVDAILRGMPSKSSAIVVMAMDHVLVLESFSGERK